ncbi:peptidoglycan D,D-transpeptidase FtsI family protein [Fictibacillus iocasae]|uniref:Peptidoglycan D,D-transpeptidase FtsI family protein n=1 Tax=Fictibacillus iocasae TaxID=2715437 RepID=A0ABW2NTS9_9BACL
MERRIKSTGFAMMMLIVLLIVRLAQIQLFSADSFSEQNVNLIEESVKQRTHSFTFHDGRGLLLDNAGNSLSADKRLSIVLFPFLKNNKETIRKLSGFLQIEEHEITRQLHKAKKPFTLKMERSISLEEMKTVNSWKVEGLYAQWVSLRKPQTFANHFIGAVGEDVSLLKKRYGDKWEKGTISRSTRTGKNGLQAAFDPFLISEGESQYVYHVDRSGSPLFGLDVKLRTPDNPLYPLQVKTTLNSRLQKIAEDSISDAGINNGGAVLLDVKTNSVLAMVSRPVFTPESVFEPDFQNQMLKLHSPGSVFKIVTAAAAIEKNIGLAQHFDCSQSIYGKRAERELGRLDLLKSFSQSCNSAFGLLAQQVMKEDPLYFENFSRKLGLTPTAGWTDDVYHYKEFRHFPEEEAGQIWGNLDKQDKSSRLAISQTAIGQLNVKVTPLAVSSMMASIARGGPVIEAKGADAVLYSDGAELVRFSQQSHEDDKLSSYTYMQLQNMLRHVVTDEDGTGHALAGLPYAVAGKSGTAEREAKKDDVKWFAGYFPAQAPQYVLVVVDLKHSRENKVLEAYGSIVRGAYRLDQESIPR